MSIQPFLLRFKQPCLSPDRAVPDTEYIYDDSVDMVRWLGSLEQPLAIETSEGSGPKTKKKDLEKGEDNKDWRMWR